MKPPILPDFNSKKEPEDDFNPFPDLPPKKEKSRKPKFFVISLALILLIVFFFLGYLVYSKQYLKKSNTLFVSKQTKELNTVLTPSDRAQIYDFSSNNSEYSLKPYKVIVDPINPTKGEKQTIIFYIKHDSPITLATAMLETDTQQIEKPLKLTQGDSKDGVWTVEWKINSTYESTYHFIHTFSDGIETYEGLVSGI